MENHDLPSTKSIQNRVKADRSSTPGTDQSVTVEKRKRKFRFCVARIKYCFNIVKVPKR